uniref:Uncharacterized protein n=1 Tax=Lotus japonicus TaxID=34305 RepID=I3T650_LOTJA|nr:unknown [Lotus japonicus]
MICCLFTQGKHCLNWLYPIRILWLLPMLVLYLLLEINLGHIPHAYVMRN